MGPWFEHPLWGWLGNVTLIISVLVGGVVTYQYLEDGFATITDLQTNLIREFHQASDKITASVDAFSFAERDRDTSWQAEELGDHQNMMHLLQNVLQEQRHIQTRLAELHGLMQARIVSDSHKHSSPSP